MKRGFFDRCVVGPIVALLTQGITPEKIALSLAFGIVLGIFPVLGSTTILCAAAALIFRLNLPAIQLVNYLIYPLQLFFLLPFIRFGEILFRSPPLQLSLTQMLALMRADLPHAVATLWLAEMHAVSAWLLIGPPTILLLYFLLSRALRQVAAPAGLRSNTAKATLDSHALLEPPNENCCLDHSITSGYVDREFQRRSRRASARELARSALPQREGLQPRKT